MCVRVRVCVSVCAWVGVSVGVVGVGAVGVAGSKESQLISVLS